MSIVSTLALMASAIIAKISPPSPEAELAALQARLDDLNRRYDENLAAVTRQRDDWQSLALSYRREVMERRGAHFITDEMRQRVQAQMQAQQCQAQSTQIQNGPMLGQTVFGAHNLGQQIDAFVCNCVPARHDMLLR